MVGAGLLNLVRKRQARDDAFAERLRVHRTAAYRLAMKIVGQSDMAEDVAQSALILAWKKRESLQDDAALSAWLRQIVVRTALNTLTRSKATRVLDEAMSKDHDLSEALQVSHVLSRLEPHHRAILALSAGEQLSYREIAEALDIPEGTVSSRLHTAKKAFKELWEEE